MSIPPDDPSPPPRSLKPEDNYPSTAIPTPLNPDYKPASKEEGTVNAGLAKDRYDEYRRASLAANTPIKETSGTIYKWVEKPNPQAAALRAEGATDEEIAALGGASDSGSWVPDASGQMVYDAYQDALSDAKSASSNVGNVRSYLDTEADKTSEITRQFKDFANRASVYEDLLLDEQKYGMNADDQNIANQKAQRDLGTASAPYYTDMPMSSALSSILRPSLPGYVRPDYRLNQAVGLPGAEGFDDPDYNASGMPFYGSGTDGWVPVKPFPPIPWPWRAN